MRNFKEVLQKKDFLCRGGTVGNEEAGKPLRLFCLKKAAENANLFLQASFFSAGRNFVIVERETENMNCCWSTITTEKLDESVNFYTEILGLYVARRFSPFPGTKIAFLKDGNGFKIELLQNSGPAGAPKEGISLGFEVKSLADTLALVQSKQIPAFGGPTKVPGCSFFFVKDPNGVSIQFVENDHTAPETH
jgi:lactoylglutathione lyase